MSTDNREYVAAEKEFLRLMNTGNATLVFNYLYGLRLELLTEILRRNEMLSMGDAVIKQYVIRTCTDKITSRIKNTPMPVRQLLV